MINNDTVKIIVKTGIACVILYFLGKIFYENWSELLKYDFSVNLTNMAFAWFCRLGHIFLMAFAWHLITKKMKMNLTYSQNISKWFYSNLGKYLPGKVWLLVGRAYLYQKENISKKMIAAAFSLEVACGVIASGIVIIVSIVVCGLFEFRSQLYLILLLVAAGLIFLHPKIFAGTLNWFLVKLKRATINVRFKYIDLLEIILVYIISWVLLGVGFYFLTNSIISIEPDNIVFMTGALAFSGIIGMLAFFVPAGLGIQEGALVILLSRIMPGSIAVLISIVVRLWLILTEIFMVILVKLINIKQSKRI